jgi:trans-AT polyketide synthase/acyltransferase/oxidoreductase domain-containing protein
MGGALFDEFPHFTARANDILGYSVPQLCREDPQSQLGITEFTQPALYVVGCLSYLKTLVGARPPDFLCGHSLGEYCALFAAGAYDFETGLRLVRHRAQLMRRAQQGSMMAVLGLGLAQVEAVLSEAGEPDVSVANDNAPQQVVLAGAAAGLQKLTRPLEAAGAQRCVMLNVSGAFHSQHMSQAAREFTAALAAADFADPRIPVIANVTGEPYAAGSVREILGRQIESRVQWRASMQYLLRHGVAKIAEIGPGKVLTGLFQANRVAVDTKSPSPAASIPTRQNASPQPVSKSESPPTPALTAEKLGSASFRRDYGVRLAYVAGAMYKGIASKELVVRMGKAGLIGFLGSGGLRLAVLEAAIRFIQAELAPGGAAYGFNLLHHPYDPRLEAETVDLFLRYDVRNIEAAAYLEITEPLVYFRLKGAHRDSAGLPVTPRRVIAKVSRPEVARAFLRPAPEAILRSLVSAGKLTAAEAAIGRELPVSGDLCVEADSGGHTDGGVAYALMPAMKNLRDEMLRTHGYRSEVRLGAAGGIGSPEAAAAAFVLGADFILTGSVNQCSPESGASEAVKDMLQRLDVQDTAYAPAGDLFEAGSKVQVMKKGVLFPARANKLYELYRHYDSLEAMEPTVRSMLERTYFKRSLEEVWREVREYYQVSKPERIELAERNPKQKMALVFRWYFAQTSRLAMEGDLSRSADFQVHCGPAMGAFNRFARGTDLEDWRQRHVDRIAERLMRGAAEVLAGRLASVTHSSA